MKKSIMTLTVLSLAFLVGSQVYAQSSTEANQPRSFFNNFTVANNTDKDIAYRVLSAAPTDIYYGIKQGKHSKYHAKFGDSKATFEVRECKRVNLSGLCLEFGSSKSNCVGGAHYDAYKIKGIIVNSLNSCAVTCNDGSSTSCLAK